MTVTVPRAVWTVFGRIALLKYEASSQISVREDIWHWFRAVGTGSECDAPDAGGVGRGVRGAGAGCLYATVRNRFLSYIVRYIVSNAFISEECHLRHGIY